MTYGTGSYGTGGYGGASSALNIVAAFAASTNSVRVTLASEPQHMSAFLAGDALNPDTWEVTDLDTGKALTVVEVEAFDLPLIWDVKTLEPFRSVNIQHRVKSTKLKSVLGGTITIPNSFDFQGMLDAKLSTPAAVSASRNFSVTDIANRAAPSSNVLGGTLQINAGGDYATVDGVELVTKLIIRRLITPRGGFSHLPDYGLGLAVKEPIRASSLLALKTETELQMELEPEVKNATASLLLSSDGILTMRLRAELTSTGQEINIPLEFPPQGVSL